MEKAGQADLWTSESAPGQLVRVHVRYYLDHSLQKAEQVVLMKTLVKSDYCSS